MRGEHRQLYFVGDGERAATSMMVMMQRYDIKALTRPLRDINMLLARTVQRCIR